MPQYEHVYIVRQDVSPPQVEQMSEHFKGVIEAAGGNILKQEYWGLRNFSYRIKKYRKGHYTLFNIDAPHDAVSEMERQMRINEDVLRYLTVRADTLDDKPSVMMQSRREGRGRDRERGDRGYRPRERDRDDGEERVSQDEER